VLALGSMSQGSEQAIISFAHSHPFVCLIAPFVCIYIAYRLPFVGTNIPFVGISQNHAGFNLVELMGVLVIIGVLAGLAVPALNTMIASQRLTGQANDLIADLTFARSEAIRTGANTVVCKTTNPFATPPSCDTTVADAWTPGRLIFVDNGTVNNQFDNASETILRVRPALEGAVAANNRLFGEGAAATDSVNRVVFRANGTTQDPSTEQQFLLCDRRGGTEARAVVINPTGRARVVKEKGQDKTGAAITCP